MTQWLDISSAPKDGTAFLAALPDSDLPHSVRWLNGGWVVACDIYWLGPLDQPTHWQPLPPPPGESQ